jgi:ATP-dependent exoDNAse (exonuclease V) beta subunit
VADSQPDQAARERISGELGSTLFVEAGAGSGKTTELVKRVVALVTSGEVELGSVAAITFTDKAATELRDRLRQDFERTAERDPDSDTSDRCRKALEQLDGSAIGTLHSFAQRILSEHPIEAGLPPRVEVVDEVSSEVAFGRRWVIFRDRLLADGARQRTILLLAACGIRFDALRVLARTFNDNWDLVAERVEPTAPDPPDARGLVAPVLDELEQICAEPCSDPGDAFRVGLDQIAEYVADLRRLTDELDLVEALPGGQQAPSFKLGNKGRQASFTSDLKELRLGVREAGDRLEAIRIEVANACVTNLGCALRELTLVAADERRRHGQLEFHDLLVRARGLLRDTESGPSVRARLHERYQRLLLDEFQDTDPIQIELAVRIAAARPDHIEAGIVGWDDLAVTPGRLFFVGDPKQSIYRFRRADISMFLAAADVFGADGGAVVLTTNFRSGQPVIEWVNQTFDHLIGEPDHDDLPVPSQPRYVRLDWVRPGPPVGPSVAVVGPEVHPSEATADEIRAAEAAGVAAAVAQAVEEEWSVDDGAGGWRPARPGDVTILLPARTSLPFIEDALEDLGIPSRAESSSLVYSSRAVRDLLMVLRAVADPTNQLHLVAALRTPLFACGDDDLFRFRRERSGRWSLLAEQPDTVPVGDPVGGGLEYLRALYAERHWLAPSELLDRISRERRAMDLGFAAGRPRDTWRRIRFVIDQARLWSESTGGNLRQYLAWVDMQTAEGARVAEAVLPETDDDAVRIMTIHSAKGLEFPIAVVSGVSTVPQARRAQAEVVFPPSGRVGYRVGPHARTDEYTEWVPIDEQMGLHERIRLLYVACTRARDHLVVSVHRKARAKPPAPERRTNAELLIEGMEDRVAHLPVVGEHRPAVSTLAPEAPPPPLPRSEWESIRETALRLASRPTTVSATSLTEEGEPDVEEEPADPGLQKRPRDLDLPPWLKGRYGTAVGRAVHGVLQTIDLATGAGLDAAVAAQCEAEAVVERTDDVRHLVSHALDSPSVQEASGRPHWREVYACVPVGGRLLEGYIDLLYRSSAGLVVVDYKTAGTSDPAELDRRVGGYTTQGASYALTVSEATGEPVVEVTFVFLTPDGPVERSIPQLDQALDSVRAVLSEPAV